LREPVNARLTGFGCGSVRVEARARKLAEPTWAVRKRLRAGRVPRPPAHRE